MLLVGRPDNTSVTVYTELAGLVLEVARAVDAWTGHAQWTVEPHSPAAAELANAEVRRDDTPWGDRPIRTVFQYAQMEIKYTVEMGRCVESLVRAERPTPGIEVLTRTSLEAASITWYLMQDNITARQRVCRMQLLRRYNAWELKRSIEAVGGSVADAGKETIAGVESYGADLGLSQFGKGGKELEREKLPGYRARVDKFLDDVGYRGAYGIYSGSAHAELAGLWRLFTQTASMLGDRSPIYDARPDPRTIFAAVNGTLRSMIMPMERIAAHFGWPAERADALNALIDRADKTLGRLKP